MADTKTMIEESYSAFKSGTSTVHYRFKNSK